MKTKAQLVLRKNITLEMNKFIENECLPTFKFKLKFLENLRRPLTLKSTRKRIEEKNKMQRRGKKAKRQFLPRKTKQALRKKTGVNAEKIHTDDELVSFKYNMVSKNTRDNEKARKSCEHFPDNGKKKFNQTRRRSDNRRSARVDCHIYRRRNKYL